MKVKELIELLKAVNPEAEVSSVDHSDYHPQLGSVFPPSAFEERTCKDCGESSIYVLSDDGADLSAADHIVI